MEEMKLPLDNKEVLDAKDTLAVSKFKYRALIVTSILSTIVALFTAFIPVIQQAITSEEKQMLRKKQEEDRYRAFIDSVQELEDLKIQQQTYHNISKVNELMNDLRKSLPMSSGISIYYTHDSGGVPVSGSPLNVTILYAANNEEPCLGKSYWQDKPLPIGYFNYNHKVYNEKFVYLPDITIEENIYIDETKDQLECNGTQAMMGIVLKETAFGTYFIGVAWTAKDPLLQNHRAKIVLKKYAALIEPLIQGKRKTFIN